MTLKSELKVIFEFSVFKLCHVPNLMSIEVNMSELKMPRPGKIMFIAKREGHLSRIRELFCLIVCSLPYVFEMTLVSEQKSLDVNVITFIFSLQDGNTLLHLCCINNHPDCLQLLLDQSTSGVNVLNTVYNDTESVKYLSIYLFCSRVTQAVSFVGIWIPLRLSGSKHRKKHSEIKCKFICSQKMFSKVLTRKLYAFL